VSAIIKNNPKGVDVNLQQFQQMLYAKLKALWSLNDNNFTAYGRAYKNKTTDGYIPEVYTGNKNYSEVFFNDKLAASLFFTISDTVNYNSSAASTTGSIIFMVDLSKIFTTISHRPDEEVRNTVQKLVMPRNYGFEYVGTETGIDNVFKDFSGWRKTSGVKFDDMHPRHCFKVNFNILFDLENFNC
jgi:hypothetical protein